MRFSKLLSGMLFCLLFPATAFAVVGVTSSELQAAADIVFPSGDSLESLEGYSSFSLQEQRNVTGGILANYKARLSSDPWFEDELPELQILVYSYADQDTAQATFDSLSYLSSFTRGQKSIIESDERTLVYSSDGGSSVDVFGTISAEYISYHMIHVNGNVLYQTSIYRTDGQFNQENLETYAEAITDTDHVIGILDEAIESMKLGLGILFPPTSTDLSAKSEKSSLNLSELYDIASHGSVNFDLYISEPEGAVGTVLDSSGISSPEEGDIYLYLHSDGSFFAGIYAPEFDADCNQQSGWYRIVSDKLVHPYEWNEVSLHYGVGGFYLVLNGDVTASCSVSQPRSERDLYFGDFPDDSIEESMIGYVNNMEMEFSLTDSGLVWDEVLSEQLFLDLPNTDPEVAVFQFLKEEGVFLGSDGMLYPDNYLNRAEMVKILLKAFDYSAKENSSVPFWDVPDDAWYLQYLAKAYSIGMIEGHEDGRFLPAHEINRAEFFTMLYRIAGSSKISYNDEFNDVTEEDWFMPGAAFALSNKLIGNGSFEPGDLVTRRSAAKALYKLLK